MPASFNPLAISLSDSAPAACRSLMIGAISATRESARACRAAVASARTFLVGTTPRSPPSFLPRLLAAASASLVRLLIIRRPSSATIAMIPTVSGLALGMSAATKSMPAFSRPSRQTRRGFCEMEIEDGAIWVYGVGEDGVQAFTDFGIDRLIELIQMYRENPELLSVGRQNNPTDLRPTPNAYRGVDRDPLEPSAAYRDDLVRP